LTDLEDIEITTASYLEKWQTRGLCYKIYGKLLLYMYCTV